MLRKFSKRTFTATAKYGLLLLAGVVTTPRHADAQPLNQLRYLPYLQMAAMKVNQPVLSYRYKVALVDSKAKKIKDSTEGVLYRSYGSFLDSSGLALSLMGGGYFLKADHNRKTALFCKIAVVQKKLGLQPEDMNSAFLTIPDSMLTKISDLKADETAETLVLTYTLKQGAGNLREMAVTFNRKDMSLIAMKMTVDEADRWGSSTGYSRVFYMSGFSNQVDADRFRLARYVTVDGAKAKLLGYLKSYTIQTFL